MQHGTNLLLLSQYHFPNSICIAYFYQDFSGNFDQNGKYISTPFFGFERTVIVSQNSPEK